ncbi:MAG: hypothetical protein HWN68_19150 [Desulfobacterales bacterium]|nr:hypothetical protein [Desulfobacterales bacterium]
MSDEKKDPPEVTLTIPSEWIDWLKQNALLLGIICLILILIIVVVWRTRKSKSPRRYLYEY